MQHARRTVWVLPGGFGFEVKLLLTSSVSFSSFISSVLMASLTCESWIKLQTIMLSAKFLAGTDGVWLPLTRDEVFAPHIANRTSKFIVRTETAKNKRILRTRGKTLFVAASSTNQPLPHLLLTQHSLCLQLLSRGEFIRKKSDDKLKSLHITYNASFSGKYIKVNLRVYDLWITFSF